MGFLEDNSEGRLALLDLHHYRFAVVQVRSLDHQDTVFKFRLHLLGVYMPSIDDGSNFLSLNTSLPWKSVSLVRCECDDQEIIFPLDCNFVVRVPWHRQHNLNALFARNNLWLLAMAVEAITNGNERTFWIPDWLRTTMVPRPGCPIQLGN